MVLGRVLLSAAALTIGLAYAYLPKDVTETALQSMWSAEPGNRNRYCDNLVKDNINDVVAAARLLDAVLTASCQFMTPGNKKIRPISVSVLYAAAPQPDQRRFLIMKYLGISNYGRRCLNKVTTSAGPQAVDLRRFYDDVVLQLWNELGIVLGGRMANSSRILPQVESIKRQSTGGGAWPDYMARFGNNTLRNCALKHGVAGACSEDLADYAAIVDGMTPLLISTVDVAGRRSQRVMSTKPQCAKCHYSRLYSRRSVADYVPKQVVYDRIPDVVPEEQPLHDPTSSDEDVFQCSRYLGAGHVFAHPPERVVCDGCIELGRNVCLWSTDCNTSRI
ncbi:Uncharacterized protein PBTT_01724 [Plasmodiophora brassicae]